MCTITSTTVRRWLWEVDTAALVAMRTAGLSGQKLATESGMSRTGVRRRVLTAESGQLLWG